jgi:hypothetical protein
MPPWWLGGQRRLLPCWQLCAQCSSWTGAHCHACEPRGCLHARHAKSSTGALAACACCSCNQTACWIVQGLSRMLLNTRVSVAVFSRSAMTQVFNHFPRAGTTQTSTRVAAGCSSCRTTTSSSKLSAQAGAQQQCHSLRSRKTWRRLCGGTRAWAGRMRQTQVCAEVGG